MFVANEIVEPDLVRRAARLATDEWLHVIAETVSRGRFYAAQMDLPRFLQAGREFHHLIGVAAENGPLTSFIVQNQERADLYLLAAGKTISADDMRASNDQHEAILDAIVRRDPDEAARLVIVHAHSTRVRLASLFSDEEERGRETDQIDEVYG
jgi:DNA-binding GntR family transcriptional regulator